MFLSIAAWGWGVRVWKEQSSTGVRSCYPPITLVTKPPTPSKAPPLKPPHVPSKPPPLEPPPQPSPVRRYRRGVVRQRQPVVRVPLHLHETHGGVGARKVGGVEVGAPEARHEGAQLLVLLHAAADLGCLGWLGRGGGALGIVGREGRAGDGCMGGACKCDAAACARDPRHAAGSMLRCLLPTANREPSKPRPSSPRASAPTSLRPIHGWCPTPLPRARRCAAPRGSRRRRPPRGAPPWLMVPLRPVGCWLWVVVGGGVVG